MKAQTYQQKMIQERLIMKIEAQKNMHPYNPTEYYKQTASSQGAYTPRNWVMQVGKRN
jgi:hypothetical protein